jgi:hypothetical protein
MSDIPPDIMKAARDVVDVLDAMSDRYSDEPRAQALKERYAALKSEGKSFSECSAVARSEFIARAIMAERKRATEEERNLCALILQDRIDALYADPNYPNDGMPSEVSALLAARMHILRRTL